MNCKPSKISFIALTFGDDRFEKGKVWMLIERDDTPYATKRMISPALAKNLVQRFPLVHMKIYATTGATSLFLYPLDHRESATQVESSYQLARKALVKLDPYMSAFLPENPEKTIALKDIKIQL